MSNATFNERGLELILIEVVAGVGRTHAASAVGAAAAAAAAVLIGWAGSAAPPTYLLAQ